MDTSTAIRREPAFLLILISPQPTLLFGCLVVLLLCWSWVMLVTFLPWGMRS